METRPKRLFLMVLPQNVLVPSQQSLAFFLQENPPLLLKDLTGVVAGTGSLIKRRWNGRGGGRQLGPGIVGSRSSPGAVFVEQVSAPVLLGENTLDNADFTGAGSENEFYDAQLVVLGAGAENDFHDAQVVIPGSSGVAVSFV